MSSPPLFRNAGEHDLIPEPRSIDGSPSPSDINFINDDILGNADMATPPPPTRPSETALGKRPRVVDSDDENDEPAPTPRRGVETPTPTTPPYGVPSMPNPILAIPKGN